MFERGKVYDGFLIRQVATVPYRHEDRFCWKVALSHPSLPDTIEAVELTTVNRSSLKEFVGTSVPIVCLAPPIKDKLAWIKLDDQYRPTKQVVGTAPPPAITARKLDERDYLFLVRDAAKIACDMIVYCKVTDTDLSALTKKIAEDMLQIARDLQ